ncbi:hypothetical protein MFIFM68171_04077 [Madurella fahalii]|uniref:NmrA-like domain-containing protein n=1 Tax=Madurella fahalii TaxID=1157608 RepID=A0ABQ0G7X5_9PEZI
MKQRASRPSMMRIAIAGAGGFAQILAQQINQTAHALLVISRRPHPELEEYCPGCQVAVVDYADVEDLRYTLRGVDLLISTIAGNEQLNLIDAARKARVGVFVPSEFEGDLSHRPPNDPLDRGSHSALDLLERWSQSRSHSMRYTVFSCGIFMERFGPGGLQTYHIGAGCGIQGPDDYLVNIQEARAEIVPINLSGRPAQVSLTSVYDVAQFVTAAIELGLENWPKEFRMRGDSMTVQELVRTCSDVRGVPFSLISRPYQDAEAQAEASQQCGDWAQWYYYQRLLQTANGRYHVRQVNLNDLVNQNETTQVQPMRFSTWLERVWGPEM